MSKELELFTPYPAQKPIVKACLDKTHSTVVLNSGRQTGKTFIAENISLLWALSEQNQHIMFVSPSDAQSKKIQSDIHSMIDGLNLIKSSKQSAGDAEIIFNNNSIIRFRSAASDQSLRGYTNDYLIIDEAAFCDETTIYSVLFPTMQVRGKKTLILSTPFGYNWFYNIHQLGLEGNNEYKSFTLTYRDNPNPSIHKFVATQKQLLPPYQFAQEYEAQFISNAASIFENIEDICILNEQPYKEGNIYFMGVDIAMSNDYTVITVMDKDKNMVYIKRFNKCNTDTIITNISNAINTYQIKKCYIEKNNQGQPIIDMLKKKHNCIVPFNTSSTSKAEIINNLIHAMNIQDIKLLKNDILIGELRTFGMTVGIGGNVKFSAIGNNHDDCVMSLAITLECLNKNKYSGQYLFL